MAEKGIQSWPKVTIRLYDDHNAEVKIAGRSYPVNHHAPRQAAIGIVTERAAQLGRPIKATAVDADGTWPLVIHPDGQVVEGEVATKRRKPIWPVLVAAVLAVALIGGTALYLLVLREPGPQVIESKPSPTLPELPAPRVAPDQFAARPVPPGWSAKASWTVDIAENTNPAVSPDGSQVAVITREGRLAVLDAGGKVLWQDKVPRDAGSPVFTRVDSRQVVAVAGPTELKYWAGNGALPTEIELPDSASVRFFGSSPLVMLSSDAGASVVSGGKLHPVQNQPRVSTILLAEGDKALMARYAGPLYWSRTGEDLVELKLKPPSGGKSLNRIVAASAGYVVAEWSAAGGKVIPTVNSTVNGSVTAQCPKSTAGETANWRWVPDQLGRVAAYGECLINFGTKKTTALDQFQPLSVAGPVVYGEINGGLGAIAPVGGKLRALATGTARPWGIAGGRAIVVHASVLYALDKQP